MDIDAMVADGMKAVAAEAQPQADAATLPEVEAIQEAPEQEAPEAESHDAEPKEEAFPKKAVNAISRRDKQIGKLRAQYEQTLAELQSLRNQVAPQQQPKNQATDGAPNESEFTNYADFMEARTAFLIQKSLAERDGQQQQFLQTQQEARWVEERENTVANQAQDFIKDTPDAFALIQENADIIDGYSAPLQRLFLEADNAPLAFYNLAKEGKLEALSEMSLSRAAMEIGKAQLMPVAKPKTKAPAPLASSRGSVSGSKSITDMKTPEEMHQWFKNFSTS